MTKTPQDIQAAEHTIMKRPVGWVHNSSMYCGLVMWTSPITASGKQAMIEAEALASIDIAWILDFIFLRSRSTLERLPSASDRLPPAFCWMEITMPKKLASGTG